MSFILRSLSLSVCTIRSASPLVAGWYDALVTCRMLLAFKNSSISLETKAVPLSDTIVSKRLWVPNFILKKIITVAEVVLFIIKKTSGQRDNASIIIKNYLLWNGPAKSTRIFDHGRVVVIHSWLVFIRICWFSRHFVQPLTIASTSSLRPGHRT